MIFHLRIVVTSALLALSAPVVAAPSPSVKLICGVHYDGQSDEAHLHLKKEIPLQAEVKSNGTAYWFDQVQELQRTKKPNLVIRITGHYWRDTLEAQSFMRYSATVCEKIPGSPKVKCFGEDHSGDISAALVRRKSHSDSGRKVLSRQTGLAVKSPDQGLDFLTNYRIEHGRDYARSLDLTDAKIRDEYFKLITPVLNVTCSIDDADFGIEVSRGL